MGQEDSGQDSLRKKCPIPSFSGPKAEKYRPEKLRIRTLFTQCLLTEFINMKASYSKVFKGAPLICNYN